MSEPTSPQTTSEIHSEVENALREQREIWREISERVIGISNREFPPEAPKRILLFGVGSSHHAARLTAYALSRARDKIRIPVIACSSMGIGVEVHPQKGDWAFGFSHRGKTPVTLRALEACGRAGAFTLMVAAKGIGECDPAKYILETTPLERCEPHTMSLTGAICAVTTLLLGSKAVEEWDALRSIGDPNLDVFRSRVGRGPSVIMGEWEGEWLAREGALKLMEMARLPVRAFGTEEFFHGPQFSVTPDDVIWHVSVPKDPRNGQFRAAHQIGIFGATPLAWIPALVELQWLALATAMNLGIDPDAKPK
jgi:fructoselysine-6-P-deglycase FrlB-like protein